MRIGFCSGSYTSRSTAATDEECINWFIETLQSQGAVAPLKAYGGSSASGIKNLFWTPGLSVEVAFPEGPTHGSRWTGQQCFVVSGSQLWEVSSAGTKTFRGNVANDGKVVSIDYSAVQLI